MKKSIVYLLMFVFMTSLVYAIPGSWYGYVTLDSSTASDGTIVDAYISNSIAATTTVGAVQSDGYYLIHVEGSVGDSVSFKIYGNNVSEAAQTWSAGFHHPDFNLTATSTANGQACPTYSGYTLPTTYNTNLGCAGGYCVHNYCRAAATYCGDSYCDTGETCSSCSSDCGACSTGGGSSGGGGGTTTITCTENWLCTDWFVCTPEGTQTRQCSDQNACGTYDNKPEETQSCTYIAPVEEPALLPEPEIIPQAPEPAPAPAAEPVPLTIEGELPPPPEVKPAITPLGVGVIAIIIISLIMLIISLYLRRVRFINAGPLKKIDLHKRKLEKHRRLIEKKQLKINKELARKRELIRKMKESFKGKK